MQQDSNMLSKRVRQFIPILITAVVVFAATYFAMRMQQELPATPEIDYRDVLPEGEVKPTQVIELRIPPNATTEVSLGDLKLLDSPRLPKFATQAGNKLKLQPSKAENQKEYFLVAEGGVGSTVFKIKVEPKQVNWKRLEAELRDYLGPRLIKQYAIYLNDLGRDRVLSINGDQVFPPASMAKTVIAILVLRDVDAGKYTLDSTIPISNDLKHSTFDNLGRLAAGTEVKVSTYLEELIKLSSNTAWYHLHSYLGGKAVVNKRTNVELGLKPLYLDPHISTANQFGKMFTDLYFARTLKKNTQQYLINLMKNASPGNREGVGLGVPVGIEFANKIGYLWTETQLNYVDSALIWAKNTDYVLVVLDEDVSWDLGKVRLKELSAIIYKYLDK